MNLNLIINAQNIEENMNSKKLDELFLKALKLHIKYMGDFKIYEGARGGHFVKDGDNIIASFQKPEHAQEFVNYIQRRVDYKKFWIREVIHEALNYIREKDMMEFCNFKPSWDEFNEDEFIEGFLEYYKKEWEQ